MDKNLLKYASVGISAVVGASIILWMIRYTMNRKSKKSKRISQRLDLDFLNTFANWEDVGYVKKLWIYPIKSCAGLNVKEAYIEKSALRLGKCWDRSFFIIDDKDVMITGRRISSTLFINIEFNENSNSIILHAPDLQPLIIHLSQIAMDRKPVESKIFEHEVMGFDCGDEVADWLELVLRRKARLLYHGSIPSMRSTEKFVQEYPLMNKDDNPLYADTSSVMLMSNASIVDLAKRTSRNLPPENFRPNILVEGVSVPYDEDEWSYVKIGEVIFRCGMPCQRCIFTTINYKTGTRDPNMEPLRTLKKFRCSPDAKSPDFGLCLGVEKRGPIREGERVYVVRQR